MSGERYPAHVRLIGVIQKDSSKMFMASVLWSDECDITVYRSFGDFKKLHKQLKKTFSSKHPLRPSNWRIPRFKVRSLTTPPTKGPKSMARLKFLESYCEQLLSCDASVTQSSEVISFFSPTANDLQPEFAKNSILILPSAEATGSAASPADVAKVTQPFVSEPYRCIADYETKDTRNRPFRVAVGDQLDVIIKDKAGWWLVENEEKSLAWFPAPYLEEEEELEEEESDQYGNPDVQFRAIRSYVSHHEDEVSINIGAVVNVLQKKNNGWWLVSYNGKTGYVPSMYLQPYTQPHFQFLNPSVSNRSPSSTTLPTPLKGHDPTLSKSQGNLQRPTATGDWLRPPFTRQTSCSLEDLSSRHVLDPPTITLTEQSDPEDDTFSELNFSDDNGSQLDISLSSSPTSEVQRRGRTPPPMVSHRRSSDTLVVPVRLRPAYSDPKLSSTPTVPPRPREHEILSRCSSVTRKVTLGSRTALSPQLRGLQSR